MEQTARLTCARFARYRLLVTALVLTSATAFAAHRSPAKLGPTAKQVALPAPVAWQENRWGLCVPVWVNEVGPFTFVVDTGAGITLLSSRVAHQARVTDTGQVVILHGTGRGPGIARPLVAVRTLSLGSTDNRLPHAGRMAVTPTLPPAVDGVLDPTEVFAATGYELDFPNQTLAPLSKVRLPTGATTRWLPEVNGRRPFVRVNGQATALIDTGSSFGLAIPASKAATFGLPTTIRSTRRAWDVAGSSFEVARATSTNVWLDHLSLEQIPTDILYGVDAATPLLLGRDALRPFRIAFDLPRRTIVFQLVDPRTGKRSATYG